MLSKPYILKQNSSLRLGLQNHENTHQQNVNIRETLDQIMRCAVLQSCVLHPSLLWHVSDFPHRVVLAPHSMHLAQHG